MFKPPPFLENSNYAFSGHNHEILNMQSIPGYDVGGSLHFCCDNNVAFTASGNLSRSAARPGDCALPYGSPVISVSGSSPESVVKAAKLALRFRNKFGKDVMTELVAWRKYGHNELDEPRYVQIFGFCNILVIR